MKKSLLVIVLATSMGTNANAEPLTAGTFTMYSPGGLVGTFPDVTGDIGSGTWSVASPSTFFGFNWTAHGGTTFGPGTYTFDTIEGGVYTNVVVGPGQIGGHILFDWNTTTDIDVINVWDVTDDGLTITYTSTDVTAGPGTGANTPITAPDGILGLSMIDGSFPTFNANFDLATGIPPEPPLTCNDIFVITNPDEPIDINITTELLSTCINDQGALTLASYIQPGNGFVTDDGTNLTYTPDAGFFGLDSFTYTVDDDVDQDPSTQDTSTIEVQVGGELQGNFTMLDSNGNVFGGTNDIVFTWDGVSLNTDESDTTFGLMTIESDRPHPFNGFVWIAHHIRVYGEGTYTFDSGCTVAELEAMGCPSGSAAASGPDITMTVAAGQYGAHILFDWNTTDNIDVVNVWNQNTSWDRLGQTGDNNKLWLGTAGLPPAEDANWELVSSDVNGDDINGSPMVDGPFVQFYANFNNKPDKAGILPAPYTGTAQDTKLGSGILASMNVMGLFASLMLLVGFRHYSRK